MESKAPSENQNKTQWKSTFRFFSVCNIGKGPTENTSTLNLHFDADLNPFLKMMAEKPLTNFLNLLVTKFKEITENPAIMIIFNYKFP